MFTNKGFNHSALAIAALALLSPLMLPSPAPAVQHQYRTHTYVHRHVIPNNIVQKLQREGNFRMFLQALRETGMSYALETGHGPYTVFAPNDRAFASLTKEAFAEFFKDKERMKNVLKHHIVPRRVETADMKFDSLRTLMGDYLMTNVTPSKTITVSGAVVTKSDIIGRNGVVHSIDTIIFPLTGMENLAMAETAGVQQ